jgi:hypothetical protein
MRTTTLTLITALLLMVAGNVTATSLAEPTFNTTQISESTDSQRFVDGCEGIETEEEFINASTDRIRDHTDPAFVARTFRLDEARGGTRKGEVTYSVAVGPVKASTTVTWKDCRLRIMGILEPMNVTVLQPAAESIARENGVTPNMTSFYQREYRTENVSDDETPEVISLTYEKLAWRIQNSTERPKAVIDIDASDGTIIQQQTVKEVQGGHGGETDENGILAAIQSFFSDLLSLLGL